MALSPPHPDVGPAPISGGDLYGATGRPREADIDQGELGDCYLVSTLGQFAARQPELIQRAIAYDARDQSFRVTLHDAAGRARTVSVTQDDLRQDRNYGVDHAGGVNSPAYWSGTHGDGSRPPAWPTVMEVAYAKLNAVSATATTDADLHHIEGGWPRDPIHALTGSSDTTVIPASRLGNNGATYDALRHAIEDGRPVLLATNPMKEMPTDGLIKGNYYGPSSPFNSGHAYAVEGVARGERGDLSLTLRNPWGTNNYINQGVRSTDPLVHVDLATILANGHLQSITLGPAASRKESVSNTARPGVAPARNAPRDEASLLPGEVGRNRWAELAALGREMIRSEQAAQADSAAPRASRRQTL